MQHKMQMQMTLLENFQSGTKQTFDPRVIIEWRSKAKVTLELEP